MNRDEFFAKLAGLDEDRTKKVLWNLYWRGPAQLRERIESGLDPAQDAVRKRVAAKPPNPGTVLREVPCRPPRLRTAWPPGQPPHPGRTSHHRPSGG
jgi:hypothetical protein